MKAHDLAKQLLEGPDLEVHTEYDCEHLKLDPEDIQIITEPLMEGDPDVPYIVII